jgi:hypothetical protein
MPSALSGPAHHAGPFTIKKRIGRLAYELEQWSFYPIRQFTQCFRRPLGEISNSPLSDQFQITQVPASWKTPNRGECSIDDKHHRRLNIREAESKLRYLKGNDNEYNICRLKRTYSYIYRVRKLKRLLWCTSLNSSHRYDTYACTHVQ